ncbi:MAG: V-type ATP synthase subunit C [Methanobacterium sp.]
MADTDTITSLATSLGFNSNEALLIVVLILVAIVGIMIIVVKMMPVLEIYPYGYPNARVRARMGRLFTEKQFSEIIEANSLNEVKDYLRGIPEYAKYVDKYPLEKALDTQLAESYDLVARISPESIRDSFRVLLSRWDVQNIKSILIAKEAGLTPEETLNLIIPYGENFTSIEKLVDTKKLAEAKNISELITGLEGTKYAKVLEDAIPIYESTGLILPLEASLDKYFLDKLLKATKNPDDENKKTLYSYIGTQVDINNLKIILRAKIEGLKYEDIEPYITSGGYQLKSWKLKDIMESDDIAAISSSLEGSNYAQIVADAMSEYSKTGSVAPIEAALETHLREMAKTISLKVPFGIGPIIGFISRKETEIKNLKVIARAKREMGFPTSEIKEMLV